MDARESDRGAARVQVHEAGLNAVISDQWARILRAEMKCSGVEPPPVIDNAKEAAPSARPRSLR